jgi:hypothetical protein
MFTSRCTTPRACALAQPRRQFRSGDHRRRDFSFLESPLQLDIASHVLTITHDHAHPTPQRTPSARRRPPARWTLVRARRRGGDGCAVVGRGLHHALVANEPAERPKAAVGRRDGQQDERVRVPIARRRRQRCRVRVPRGRAIARRPSPPDRSGSTRPTCAMSQVGRSRFTIGGARCTTNT